MLQFQTVKGRFPPIQTLDANGKPMHSWRVLLVPYLESSCFFDAYDLQRPWNEGNNAALLSDFQITYADGSIGNCAEVYKFFCCDKPTDDRKYSTLITMVELDAEAPTFSGSTEKPKRVFLIAWKKCSIHWMNPSDYTVNDIRVGKGDCNVEEIEAMVVFSESRKSYTLLESDEAVQFARNTFIRDLMKP